jgi:phospholipid N-methyltransferase
MRALSRSADRPMSASPTSWFADASLYIQKFATRGRTFASVAPSSRSMAKVASAYVDPAVQQDLLELGAGTGSVTSAIVQRMHAESRLVAIEIEPDLADLVRQRNPRAVVVQGCAGEASARLVEHGMTRLDAVISGLAFPSLPAAVCRAVLACYRDHAKPDAVYSQLTVSPWVFLPLYKRLFEDVRFAPAMWNVPPGGIYHCRGLREDFERHLPNQ